MDPLNSRDEADLIGAVEQSIVLANGGLHPNDAITKVASDKKYGPDKVRRMTEAFNKSKSVHVLKTAAGDDRAKPFPIADVSEILSRIYMPQEKSAAVVAEIPKGSFVDFDFNAMQKTASAAPEKRLSVPDREFAERVAKTAALAQQQIAAGIEEQLRMKVQEYKYAFDTALDDLCEHLAPLSDFKLRKAAQMIVNRHQTTGNDLLKIAASRINREIPDMQKTANTVVFPTKEPFLSVSRLYDAANRMAAAELAYDEFRKTAADLPSMATGAIASMIASAGLNPTRAANALAAQPPKSIEEGLDAPYYNKTKGNDAKRAFLLLALYDKDLKQYPMAQLREAYNAAVQMAPDAYRNPVVLKNMMLRNVQTSDVKDPFEMQQELGIGDLLTKRRTAHEQMLAQEKARAALLKPKPAEEGADLGKSRTYAAAKELGGTAVDIAQGFIKPGDKKGKTALTPQEQIEKNVADDLASILRIAPAGGIQSAGGIPVVKNALTAFHTRGHAGLTPDEMKQLSTVGYIP